MSLIAFIGFAVLLSWTGYQFMSKSVQKVSNALKPRTGEQIYDALFGNRETKCVKVLHKRDQVIPRIDDAIWLEFETCPEELKRILSKHKFTAEKLSTQEWDPRIPYGETLEWFNPTNLGDTIMVYEYSTPDNRNFQTIWSNLDSTRAFVRDFE